MGRHGVVSNVGMPYSLIFLPSRLQESTGKNHDGTFR